MRLHQPRWTHLSFLNVLLSPCCALIDQQPVSQPWIHKMHQNSIRVLPVQGLLFNQSILIYTGIMTLSPQVGISTWMSTASLVTVTSATSCGTLWSLLWRLWETTLYHQRKPRWDQEKRQSTKSTQTKTVPYLFIFTQWHTYHIVTKQMLSKKDFGCSTVCLGVSSALILPCFVFID